MGGNRVIRYVHLPQGEEIGFPERAYWATEERLEYKGRKVLYLIVDSTGNTLCGRSYIYRLETVRVVGYINRWKCETNEKGEVVSEIEPIEDEETQRGLRKILRDKHMQYVYF